MNGPGSVSNGKLLHVVTLSCKDGANAARCLEALAAVGRADAVSYGCASYEFGLKAGTTDTVYIVERWKKWEDLDALLGAKVVPALPMYNQLLKRPFDPATDTVRIEVAGG